MWRQFILRCPVKQELKHSGDIRPVVENLIQTHLTCDKQTADLTQLKSKALSLIRDSRQTLSFDMLYISLCAERKTFYEAGNKFVRTHVMNQSQPPGLAVIGAIFRFFRAHNELCRGEDKQLILQLYHHLNDKYGGVLDSKSRTAAADALSLTNRWKDLKGFFINDSYWDNGIAPDRVWCAYIEAALRENLKDEAIRTMDEGASHGMRLINSTYHALLKDESSFTMLMQWLARHGIFLNEVSTEPFLSDCPSILNRPTVNTTISNKGVCRNCGTHLMMCDVTAEELNQLKNVFLQEVFIGRDVHIKSNPEEFQRYLRFIENLGKVDVVIDGLNVAYATNNTNPHKGAKLLKNVVAHFVKGRKKVLVIGRKHMKNWPKPEMSYIENKTKIFMAENLSSDDPLTLFAAMSSGVGTYILSKDLMRSHRFLLKSPSLRRVFSNWLQIHQYQLQFVDTSTGAVFLRPPALYLEEAQMSESGRWHVPISKHLVGVPGYRLKDLAPWLCIAPPVKSRK